MPSTINASNSGAGGLISAGDASGVLALQTAGTTAITVDTSQNSTFAGSVKTNTLTSASATALTLQSAGTTAVTLDTSGNVGIGTTSPASKFHVAGGSGSTIRNTASAGSSWFVGSNVDSYILHNESNTPMIFTTNGSERMRIDSSGNLQLGYGGQTTTAFTAPQGITIGSLDNVALQYYLRKGNQVEARIGFKASTDTNLYVGTGGGAGPSGIGVYGLYQANTSTSWTAVSDERFKTELQPIENALDKISNVRAVTGRYSYDEENGVTKRRPFLIAQDFVTALPEAVDQKNPDQLGLSYSDTVVLAFAAIKELKAINDTQAETLTQQTEAINALTARIVALEQKGTV